MDGERGRDAVPPLPGADLAADPLDCVPGSGAERVPLFTLGIGTGATAREVLSTAMVLVSRTRDGVLAQDPPSGLLVGLTYAPEGAPGVCGASLTLRATTSRVTVRDPAVVLGLAVREPAGVHWADGVQLEKQNAFPVSFLRQEAALEPGMRRQWRTTESGWRPTSSNRYLPWFAVVGAQGWGTFCTLRWSGAWCFGLEYEGGICRLSMGLDAFEHTLEPGETLTLPEVLWGSGPGGLEGASQRSHEALRGSVPAWPDGRGPWVQFNSWYPWAAKLEEGQMLRQLDVAARIGVEVFVLDDGWFVGGGRPGVWGSGAGTWREDPAKFPAGLRSFGQRVKALGLRFGLWVEPERVDLQQLGDSGLDPSWLATQGGRRIERDTLPSAQVCLGCPAAVAWAKERLLRLLTEAEVDWVKWDHNLYGICDGPDHGHQVGDGNWAHIRGVWEVLDHLRSRLPHLVIENCASGGSRLDPGMLARSHLTWTSDIPAPSRRARSQFAGAALAYPPEHLNAWVIPHEPAQGRLSYLFRSRFLGAFGLSIPLDRWGADEEALAAREIALYKRWRSLRRRAVLHQLLPQETAAEAWYAVELASPDGGEGAVLAFREGGAPDRQVLRLRQLRRGSRYLVTEEDRGVGREVPGSVLMEEGLLVDLPEPSSAALFWLRAL